MFLQHVKSTGTSGNMLVAKVYVYRSVCFSPFWTYVGGINVSIMTANKIPPSLPFARPRTKAKTLVVDQELLLCRLHFKDAMFIKKFSSAI
jgi:hypothetical protein